MHKMIAGLLGAVSILAIAAPSQAAVGTGFDPSAVQQVQYYHHYYHHRHWHRHWHPRAPVVVIAPR